MLTHTNSPLSQDMTTLLDSQNMGMSDPARGLPTAHGRSGSEFHPQQLVRPTNERRRASRSTTSIGRYVALNLATCHDDWTRISYDLMRLDGFKHGWSISINDMCTRRNRRNISPPPSPNDHNKFSFFLSPAPPSAEHNCRGNKTMSKVLPSVR